LTQTKVFLLLESKHYRRYGGTPELVACFEDSNFMLNEDEQINVEVKLETTEILNEKRSFKRKPSKRTDDHSPEDSSPPKKSRPNVDPSPSKNSRSIGQSRALDGNYVSASNGDQEQRLDVIVKRENDVSFTENQIDEVFDHLRRTDPILGLQFSGQRLSSSTGYMAQEEEEYYSDGDGGDPDQQVLNNATDPDFRPGMYSLENVKSSRKYREISSAEDVTLAYVKGTREFQLLGSTLYDIGKEIGLNCPVVDVDNKDAKDEAKKYLNAQMLKYLPLFERFKHVDKRPFRDVLKTQMPESYMKNRMRCGFVKARPKYYKSKPKSAVKKGKKANDQADLLGDQAPQPAEDHPHYANIYQ